MSNAYTIFPASYAKGKVIIRAPSSNGFKTRAACLAGDGLGLNYVGRSKGYTASPAQAERFERLYVAGFDASYVTGALSHRERGLKGLTWREADRLAKQWAREAPQEGAQSASASERLSTTGKAPDAPGARSGGQEEGV